MTARRRSQRLMAGRRRRTGPDKQTTGRPEPPTNPRNHLCES
jgi:hypothetical protein